MSCSDDMSERDEGPSAIGLLLLPEYLAKGISCVYCETNLITMIVGVYGCFDTSFTNKYLHALAEILSNITFDVWWNLQLRRARATHLDRRPVHQQSEWRLFFHNKLAVLL